MSTSASVLESASSTAHTPIPERAIGRPYATTNRSIRHAAAVAARVALFCLLSPTIATAQQQVGACTDLSVSAVATDGVGQAAVMSAS